MIFKKILFCCTVCVLLVGSTLASIAPSTIPSETKVLVRISISNGLIQLPENAEIISENSGKWIDVILLQSQLNDLQRSTIEYSILLADVEQYSRSVAGSYHSLAEMEDILQTIASNYPTITQLKSIGTTFEGRPIWCLEISDAPGVDDGEPGVYFMGVHHAREWPTLEICLYIAQQLTSEYGSDLEITGLVNSRRIWITPCVNPDGYYYCHDQGHDWRKNRHYYPEYNTYGVDLNRNYAGSCNGDIKGGWGSVGNGGTSHVPNNEVYCGQWAFSENETQAIRNMYLEHDISASITWHNYGEVVLAPWGYGSLLTPDDSYLMSVAQQIAAQITQDSGSGTYTAGKAGGISGDQTDWAYGYNHYVQGQASFAYTIESCSEFQPPEFKLDQIVSENFKGAVVLLLEAENISHVVSRVLPPQISEMTWDEDGDYTVSWEQQNPTAGADSFQLDELTGVSLWNDNAEENHSWWVLDGFTMNATRSHSAEYSYMSRNRSRDDSSMTSRYPIPVVEGMNLSFWCYFSIERNKDYAMVEVSRDGRSYDILDTFNGYASNWTYRTYSLDDYLGDSVFIRFRYTTDSYRTFAGLYVDDISPVMNVDQVNMLSDSLTEPSYHIQGKPNGTYLYQVRGHNTAHGWGDFSTLQKIIVGNNSLAVDISSPRQHSLYINNKRILPFFVTLAFGALNVTANVSDASDVQCVEFYIDNKLQDTEPYLPYTWTWSKGSLFRHTIKVVAIDSLGHRASHDLRVWKFF